LCHETKRKEEEAKHIEEGYKIMYYTGRTSTKNGVGVIVGEEIKSKIVD